MNTINVNGKEYILKDSNQKDERYHNLVECLTSEFEVLLDNAQTIYEYYLAEGLKTNTIEAEGYLRGIKIAVESIKEQIKWSTEDA
jgi:hypothetical protein